MRNLLLGSLTILLVQACTSKPPVPRTNKDSVSIESKQLASEVQSNLVAEITFAKGRSVVPNSAKQQLRKLYNDALKSGKIDEVKVITWGDHEYPSVSDKKLSKADRRLVTKRNDAIEDYLDSIDGSLSIDRFSMAERPNALKTMFSTEDARVKRSLETAGIPTTETSVKVPGKASKSIVIFVREEK